MANEFNIGKFIGFFCFGFMAISVLTMMLLLQVQENYLEILQHLLLVVVGSYDFRSLVELYGGTSVYGSVLHLIAVAILAAVLAYRVEASSSNEIIESGRVLRDLSHKVCMPKSATNVNSHIYLHPLVKIDKTALIGNVLCLGSQGAGKSTITKALLDQIVNRLGKVIIFDEKGEYADRYYDATDTILLGYEQDCHAWDLQTDFSSDAQIGSLANSFIDPSLNSADPFWGKMAVEQLTGFLLIARSTGLVSFQKLDMALSLSGMDLEMMVDSECPHLKEVLVGTTNTINSGLAVLKTNTAWINGIVNAEKNLPKVSVRHFLSSGNKTFKKLIIKTSHENSEVSRRIFSTVLDVVRTELLKRADLPYSKEATEHDLWLVLDELASVPKSEALKEALAKGRSKGIHVIAGTQSPSQVAEIYGLQGSTTIYNLFQNIIALKPGPLGENSEFVSKCFGMQRVRLTNKKSEPVGTESRPVVAVSQFDELPLAGAGKKGVVGFLVTPQFPKTAFKLRWQHTVKSKPTLMAGVSASQGAKAIPVKTNQVNPDVSTRERLFRGRRK